MNVTDGALGKKEAGVPGDSADQQVEAQCEEDAAGPSNEVSGLGQEAKSVTVDEYNPIKAYGETVDKAQDDLIKDRQAELTAMIQDFTVENCTRGSHTAHTIPKHSGLFVTYSIC